VVNKYLLIGLKFNSTAIPAIGFKVREEIE
jgi:hypothetical protein